MKFSEFRKYNSLTSSSCVDKSWDELFPNFVKYLPIKDKYLIGLEIEMEKYDPKPMDKKAYLDYLWAVVPDGSLRDNGAEFRSAPLKGKSIALALSTLEYFNNLANPAYNDRTGIHVHLNIRDLHVEQFLTLIAIYILFEDVLFNFSGNRKDSIYCVPLRIAENYFSHIFSKMKENPENEWGLVYQGAKKYTALNYAPVNTFGTVEFRHMAGTNNIKRIHEWINIILRIREFAEIPIQEIIGDILLLNTNSQYLEFSKRVFKEQSEILFTDSTMWKSLSEGVSILKEWCIPTDYLTWVKDQPKQKIRIRNKFYNEQIARIRQQMARDANRIVFRQEPIPPDIYQEHPDQPNMIIFDDVLLPPERR
jgi:hypothetical protein